LSIFEQKLRNYVAEIIIHCLEFQKQCAGAGYIIIHDTKKEAKANNEKKKKIGIVQIN